MGRRCYDWSMEVFFTLCSVFALGVQIVRAEVDSIRQNHFAWPCCTASKEEFPQFAANYKGRHTVANIVSSTMMEHDTACLVNY